MQRMHERIEAICNDESIKMCRARLLAAAVLHDVGHGPFSHLFEPCLGIDHEEWSVKIINNSDGDVFKVLKKIDPTLPSTVVQMIEKDNTELPYWQRSLLSSQLDVDRMDYLRRDSLFTGAGYGHFDWYRLINTIEFDGDGGSRDIVWPEKAKFAIEEYIFARYYMYQNVYLHKTTRGFEKLLEAMWNWAKRLCDNGIDMDLVPAIKEFWEDDDPTVDQYLRLEEFTVLQQIQQWKDHSDKTLSDLAHRFLNREVFAMIEAPSTFDGLNDLTDGYEVWEEALREKVKSKGFDQIDCYCMRDELKAKYLQPYFSPEKESNEQSALNAIRVIDDNKPVEISELLPRLKSTTKKPINCYRYYVPQEVRIEAENLRREWQNR